MVLFQNRIELVRCMVAAQLPMGNVLSKMLAPEHNKTIKFQN